MIVQTASSGDIFLINLQHHLHVEDHSNRLEDHSLIWMQRAAIGIILILSNQFLGNHTNATTTSTVILIRMGFGFCLFMGLRHLLLDTEATSGRSDYTLASSLL